MPLPNPPATTSGMSALAQKATGKQRRLIVILEEDYNFDVVLEMITQYGIVKRAKKIKPTEKARLIKDYLVFIAQLCIPKEKPSEDGPITGDKIKFTINIDTPKPLQPDNVAAKKPGGISITIPTIKGADGSYAVDVD